MKSYLDKKSSHNLLDTDFDHGLGTSSSSSSTTGWSTLDNKTRGNHIFDRDIHFKPWNKQYHTMGTTTRFLDNDPIFDDMKRRIEELRKRWHRDSNQDYSDFDDLNRQNMNHRNYSNTHLQKFRTHSPTEFDSSSLTKSSLSRSKSITFERGPNGIVNFIASFNLNEYDPESIKVFIRDGQLVINAKNEQNSGYNVLNHEYKRTINLPKGIEDEKLSALLSVDGILLVSCPMKPPPFSSTTDNTSNSLSSSDSFKYISATNPVATTSTTLVTDTKPVTSNSNIVIDDNNNNNDHYYTNLQQLRTSPLTRYSSYSLKSDCDRSLSRERSNKPKFQLEIPIDSIYSPGEIQIKTLNRRIYVNARHEERAPNRTAVREFSKEYDIPDHIDVESLVAKFNNGILNIEAVSF